MDFLKTKIFIIWMVVSFCIFLETDARVLKKVGNVDGNARRNILRILQRIIEKAERNQIGTPEASQRQPSDNAGSDVNTVKVFDNCLQDAESEDQIIMESFTIDENGKKHKTKCHKERVENKIKDGMKLAAEQQDAVKSKNGKRNFNGKEFKLWPGGVLPYVINNVFTKEKKEVILKAFEEIQKKTCIKLVPYKDNAPNDKAYIHIINGSSCSSYMGKVDEQPQSVWLNTNDCVYNSVVIHEVMHALGMVHEQSRQDREKYVTINWDNIGMDSSETINFRKFKTDDTNPYDLESDLQYAVKDFSTNGEATITIKQEDLAFLAGTARGLMFYDVKDITDAYKCTEHCKTKPDCQNGGFVDFNCKCYCPSFAKGDTCAEIITDNGCGGEVNLVSNPKEIKSPGYPDPYPSGKQCTWVIKAPKKKRIMLYIETLDLSYSSKNCHNWLEIRYNLPGQTGPRLCGKDNSHKTKYETTRDGPGNIMILTFDSKKVQEESSSLGFNLKVTPIYDYKIVLSEHSWGRVTIKYEDKDIKVCSDGFDHKDATVLCKQMGYDEGIVSTPDEKRIFISRKTMQWMSNLKCNGNEHRLDNCGNFDLKNTHSCTQGRQAFVECE